MATLSYAQLKALWIQNGGDPAWAPTMAAIALVESGGKTDAYNASGATGLWQIEVPLHGKSYAQMIDPNQNAAEAVSLLGNGQGISNWGKGTGDWLGTQIQTTGDKPLTEAQASAIAAGKVGPISAAGPQGAPSGGSTGFGGPSSGPGGWLIQLDAAVNPRAPAPGIVDQILGPLDLSTDVQKLGGVAEMIFVRGGLALLSLGVFVGGLTLIFGRDLTSLVTRRAGGLGSAERVSQLATERAGQSAAASAGRQAQRDAASHQRELLRQEGLSRRQRERHDLTLERIQATAAARAKETNLVGARSRARVKSEGATAERVRQQRLKTNATARAQKARQATKAGS
jgi:hypothetical protein